MRLIENISSDALQKHTILIDSGEISLILRYYSVTSAWFMDVEYKEESIFGVKMSLGVQHINAQNWPFDFIMQDTSGEDVDAFQSTDFEDGRCFLYMLEAADMKELRGYSVRL